MCIISCASLINGYYAGHKVTATSLAEQFGLNIRTLNPSLNKLTRAGILRSQVGGPDRGYIFARDPKQISIYDVIEAVEGMSYMKTCTEALKGARCKTADCTVCSLYKSSAKVIDFAREQYKKTSIYDLFMEDNAEAAAALKMQMQAAASM